MTKKRWKFELNVILANIMEEESDHFNNCLDSGEFEEHFTDKKVKKAFQKAISEKMKWEIKHQGDNDMESFLEGIALSFPEIMHDYALAFRVYHNQNKFIK